MKIVLGLREEVKIKTTNEPWEDRRKDCHESGKEVGNCFKDRIGG